MKVNNPTISGKTIVCGVEVPNISGGFGGSRKSLLVKHISEMHNRKTPHVNEAINNNRERFIDRVDVLDLKQPQYEEIVIGLVDSNFLSRMEIAKADCVYALSERGYAKLLKIFDDDLSWDKYDEILDGYFRARESAPNVNELSPILQFMIHSELEQKALKKEVAVLQSGLDTLTDNLTIVPDAAKVKDLLIQYQRWTRFEFDQIYGAIYETLLDQHGIDVRRRVSHERDRKDAEYFAKTGRHYATATLKKNVTGIDVMVRMGVLDKFHSILVGLLAKAKSERRL